MVSLLYKTLLIFHILNICCYPFFKKIRTINMGAIGISLLDYRSSGDKACIFPSWPH